MIYKYFFLLLLSDRMEKDCRSEKEVQVNGGSSSNELQVVQNQKYVYNNFSLNPIVSYEIMNIKVKEQ